MEDEKGAMEDDPIVREVDVFLSQSTGAAELYLLQYPLCPAGRGYGDSAGADVPTARIKPRQQKIELKYPINTHSATYDHARGSEIAQLTIKPDADPQNPDQGMFESGVMDCTTLSSSRVPITANYMLGVLKEDGLYLNPLHGISQLRPSFLHLDEADTIQMEKDRKPTDFHDEEEEEYKTTFKRRESERAIAARMRSHAHLQKQSDAEAWTALEYYPADSPEAVELRAKLSEPGDAEYEYNSPHQWLSALTDETAAAGSTSGADGGGGAGTSDGGSALRAPFSLVECMQLPSTEQVYKLMKQAQVMQFDELHDHVPSVEPAALVELLLSCARVIDGCWVVKSDRLFDSGANVDLDAKLRACRDHLLLALRAGEPVTRATIIKTFGLSDTEIGNMLKKIARREPVPGNPGQLSWVFIEDRDPDFESQYPQVIEQDGVRWDELATDNAVKTTLYRTRVNTRESLNAMNQIEGYDIRGTRPNQFRPMKSNPMTKTNPNPEALLLQILDELPEADTFEGGGNSVRSRLEKMCTAGLSHYGVCSLKFLKGAVDMKRGRYEEAAAAESVWGNDISSQMIESALGAVNAVEVPVCDSGNAHPERIYVYETLPGANADLNKYRKIVLGLFGASLRIKKSDILTACKNAGLPQIQPSSYLRIMHEIGESTANYWVLKAGNGATVRASGAGGR